MTLDTITTRARKAVKVLLGSYEGASRTRRASNWRSPHTGPNTALQFDLPTLRARSRDLVRNHWAASRGVAVIAHNTVGAGIIPTAKTARGREAVKVERVLKAWADTTHCDAMGRMTLYGLQSLVMRTVAEAGECLILRERVGTAAMRRMELDIPIQLKVLEPDYLDIQKDGPQPNGNFAIHGVEFSPEGRPVAYHIYQEHPGETARWSSLQSARIPAEDVAHVYRITRPGQARGVPWLAPVMIRMRDYDEYEQAQLMRQKIAATFAVFVRNLKGEPQEEESESFSLKPGMVRWLEPGEDVTFANPPGVTGYADYARVNLRAIASGLGITYEALTADYSQVNYSSARMAHLEMLANINDVRHNMLIPQFCHRVESWVKEACESVGIAADNTVWEWTAPRREMLDPTKEVGAMVKAIRAGLTSRQDEIRKLGRDSAEVLREIADDNAIADELGLILDSDPRSTTAAGLTPVGSYISSGDEQAEDTDT
jgi:lambda family phage portal protein